MSENKSTFLCGGVLFFMLMKATYPDGSARDHREGIKDEHKAPDVMSDLIYTFTGSKSYGSEKDTSNYRECKSEGTVNLPFNDVSIISAYENTIQYEYTEALGRMREFCRWHINPSMKEWLVRALLEVIEFDRNINDSDKFYIISDGSCMDKAAMKKNGDYDLEPFLVGVLYYILRERSGKNDQGADTLDYYGDKKPYKERTHKGNAGKRITRKLDVSLYEPPVEKSEAAEKVSIETEYDEEQGFTQEEPDVEVDMGFSETREQDFDNAPPGQDQGSEKTTIIQHQTNVIQKGENNFNLTNNGVMNFDFGGGRK